MKLYTEEQVKHTLQLMGESYLVNEFLKTAQPIELPSDEEIKQYAIGYSLVHEDVSDKLDNYLVCAIHIDGAMWIKKQILNQKETRVFGESDDKQFWNDKPKQNK